MATRTPLSSCKSLSLVCFIVKFSILSLLLFFVLLQCYIFLHSWVS